MNHPTAALSVGQFATLACMLEATAPKPGNVHRGADFDDLTFPEMMVSAVAIGPAMDRAVERGVGVTVLDAIRATRQVVNTNTNLGMALLLSPLAAVAPGQRLAAGVSDVLTHLSPADTALVYEAIRLAQPGGMGTVEQMDVNEFPPTDLLEAMKLAASWDRVARQFVTGFTDVFERVVPWLVETCRAGHSLTQSIVHTHVRLMAQFPDSLIARKCGERMATQAQALAAQVLEAGLPGDEDYEGALADLDFWLRCDGHRRNPGTTADLIAAGLFAALRDGELPPPWN